MIHQYSLWISSLVPITGKVMKMQNGEYLIENSRKASRAKGLPSLPTIFTAVCKVDGLIFGINTYIKY